MRFLYPTLFLAWAALVVVPLLLYLFRPRPKTVRTSTLPFFKWLAKEHQDSAWLKWLKHLLSLLITLLVIFAAAAALARLVVAPAAEAIRTVVILVDRSASMSAKQEGESLMQQGIQQATDRLAGLPAGVGVIVIAYDQRPEVLVARSFDHRQVSRALQDIQVRPLTGNPENALRLAKQLAVLETPAAIWHVTDGTNVSGHAKVVRLDLPEGDKKSEPPPSSTEETAGDESEFAQVKVVPVLVGMDKPVNVGITGFRIRRRPLERQQMEAFVQLHNSTGEKTDADLEMKLDGQLVGVRKLTFEPHSSQRLLVPIEAHKEQDRVFQLTLRAENDVFEMDNLVIARVPKLEPIQVMWVTRSPDPFTTLALTTLSIDSDIQVTQSTPAAWPPEFSKVDVVIFDDWTPKEWPANLPVVILNPTQSLGPVQVVRIKGDGVPIENLRATNTSHPLLYGVATARVGVNQTAVIASDGGALQPLWSGGQGPVLMAGEVSGQRVAVMAFSPQKSEQLPLMASYPLLIGNSIYWTAEKKIEEARGMNRRTGELVALTGEEIRWENAAGETSRPERVDNKFVELDRVGLWKTDDGRIGSAALLSPVESTLELDDKKPMESVVGAESTSAWLRGDLAPLLMWLIVGLLVVESWMYHRYVAY